MQLFRTIQNEADSAFEQKSAAGKTRSKKQRSSPQKVLVLFGTRPEIIKLAPVIRELKANKDVFETVTVSSGQHTDLLKPFVELFKIKINHDLQVMTAAQTPNEVCARILSAFDKVLETEKPDLVIVQGDTTTALAGAMAAFHRKIAVAHVEAGLRSGNPLSPFPEETNRRLISQLAAFHFAATDVNRENLIGEGVNPRQIFVTGNPVVDALQFVLKTGAKSRATSNLLRQTKNLKRILLTTHRRESFGLAMRENLRVLRDFVEKRKDAALLFPVHPNPAVRKSVAAVFGENKRVHLLEPLAYSDFVQLMANSWIIVSDSGGIQEEAPSLGKPLLVLRENTERPEAVSSGVAKLVGGESKTLAKMLVENYEDERWLNSVKEIENPFGKGDAAQKIATILAAQVRQATEKE